MFLSSGCYAAVITSEGSFKHDGNNFSPRQACEIAKKRAKEKAIIDALGLNISLEEVQNVMRQTVSLIVEAIKFQLNL